MDLPSGASSIIIKEHTGPWQVFTEVNFGGATVTLDPGTSYDNLEQMGLEHPVKSLRMDPSGVSPSFFLVTQHKSSFSSCNKLIGIVTKHVR